MKKTIQLTLFRLFGVLAPSVALSALICGCASFIPNEMKVIAIIVSLSALIFVLLNVIGLRLTFFMSKDNKSYFVASFVAYGIYMVLGAAVYLISREIYTWSFLPTKFLHFIFPSVRNWMSAGVLHIIMLALIPPVAKIPVKEPDPSEERKRGRLDLRYLVFAAGDKIRGDKGSDDEEYKFKRRRSWHPGYLIGDIIFFFTKNKRNDDDY